MDMPASSPEGFVSDRQNVYEQIRDMLTPDELRRFTRAMAKAVEVPTVPEQIVTMHGLAHHAAMNADRNLAEAFKAMAHATATDYTTELDVAGLSAELEAGMPPRRPLEGPTSPGSP